MKKVQIIEICKSDIFERILLLYDLIQQVKISSSAYFSQMKNAFTT